MPLDVASRRTYLEQNMRFAVVGLIVALGAMALRWGLDGVLPQTTFGYALGVGVSYLSGVVAAYEAHRRWTFGKGRDSRFWHYALVSAICGLVTTTLASALRIVFGAAESVAEHSGSLAFGLALGLVSVASYVVSDRWVFRRTPET